MRSPDDCPGDLTFPAVWTLPELIRSPDEGDVLTRDEYGDRIRDAHRRPPFPDDAMEVE